MAENFDIFGFELSDADIKAISGLDKYRSYKTNPNPFGAFVGGPDCMTPAGSNRRCLRGSTAAAPAVPLLQRKSATMHTES